MLNKKQRGKWQYDTKLQDRSYRKRILVKAAYHHIVCHKERAEELAVKERDVSGMANGEAIYPEKGNECMNMHKVPIFLLLHADVHCTREAVPTQPASAHQPLYD